MKNLIGGNNRSVIIPVALMCIGILLCCSLTIGIEGLSVIMGLVLVLIGLLILVNLFVASKSLFSSDGIIGILILSLGVLFLTHKLAGIVFAYIPWFLIVLGVVIIADAFMDKFIKKDQKTLLFILKIIIGALAIVLGLCLELIEDFMEYSSLILGVIMIVYAGYLLYLAVIKNKPIELN